MPRCALAFAILAAGCAASGVPIDGTASTGGGSAPDFASNVTVPRPDLAVPTDAGVPIDQAPAPPDLTSSDMALSSAPCLTGGSIVYLDGSSGDWVFSGIQLFPVPSWTLLGASSQTFWYETATQDSWMLAFSTEQLNQPLAVGRYDDAERYPFAAAGHPGFWIAGQGRGCNTVTGWFEIESLVLKPDQSGFTELTATFEQHCDTTMAAALRGCVHFEN